MKVPFPLGCQRAFGLTFWCSLFSGFSPSILLVRIFSTGLLSTFSCFCEVGRGLLSCPRRHMTIDSPFPGLCRCGCVGAFVPSSTSRAVRSSWGVCEGGGAPAWPGAAFWWCLFREHGLSSVCVCVPPRAEIYPVLELAIELETPFRGYFLAYRLLVSFGCRRLGCPFLLLLLLLRGPHFFQLTLRV